MKFGTRVRLKPSNDRGEFELDRARSKNNINENLFALGHETHNSIGPRMWGCCLEQYNDIPPKNYVKTQNWGPCFT